MAIAVWAEQAYAYPLTPQPEPTVVESSSLVSQVSSQASAQTTAQMSLLLLRKTLELQATSMAGLLQATRPSSPSNNPPHLGNSIDVTA